MNEKLVVLRGLPCSGKSLYAAQLVSRGYKRLSDIDLRHSIDNGIYTNSNQLLITDLIQIMTTIMLQSNYNVVIDCYNLNPNHYRFARGLVKEYKAELEIINFDTPLEICLQRDLSRNKDRVGKETIMKLYNTYFINGKFPTEE